MLLNSPGGTDYARLPILAALPGIEIDTIWLNDRISVQIRDGACVEQAGKRIDPARYDLVVWWPASFQYFRARLGASYFPDAGQEYVSRAWRVMEEGLLATMQRLLNPYMSSILAANKIYATHVAGRAGVPVPRTVIGNVSSGLPQLANSVVVKSITDTMDIDDQRKLLATEIDLASLQAGDEEIPAIYQERIDLDLEIRAYYFNGITKAVSLRWPPGIAPRTDIRLCAPEAVRTAIVDHRQIDKYNAVLASELNLRMFCADYLVEGSGQTYLIDVNPHGSWHWLELSVRQALDTEFVKMIRRIVARD